MFCITNGPCRLWAANHGEANLGIVSSWFMRSLHVHMSLALHSFRNKTHTHSTWCMFFSDDMISLPLCPTETSYLSISCHPFCLFPTAARVIASHYTREEQWGLCLSRTRPDSLNPITVILFHHYPSTTSSQVTTLQDLNCVIDSEQGPRGLNKD
jgi:hypothetical protein